MVDVKALGPPHVLRLWLGEDKGMLLVRYFCYNKSRFLCQFDFLLIMRVSQSSGESGHLLFFCGILPDLNQWCLSVCYIGIIQLKASGQQCSGC